MEAVEAYVLRPLEDALVELTLPQSGRYAGFWFRSPRMHVLETLLWNAVVIAIWIGITPCRAAARVGHGLSTAVAAEATGARPRPWSDVVLGLVMALFVALQFVVKYTRGGWLDVWYLLMPCHVYTAALAFCLLSRDRRWVNRVFTVVGVYYAWGPILALAFPDFSDQVYEYEKYVYVIHHVVIISAPYYMVTQRDRFTVLPMSPFWLGWVVMWGIVLQMDLQTLASYHSGININFQLSPPPLPVAFEFLRDELYRFKMFGVLAIMCLVMHALVVGIGNVVAPAPRQAAKQGSQGRPKQQ